MNRGLMKYLPALLIAFTAVPGPTSGDEPAPLVTAIRADQLMSDLGLQPERPPDLWHQLTYQYRQSSVPRGGLSFGVFASVSDARAAVKRMDGMYAVPPSSQPADAPGDELIWRCGSSSASAILRRANVVFRLYRVGACEDALALARQIDERVRNDRNIAPLGAFSEPPSIDIQNPPTTLIRGSGRATLQVSFRGMGDPARVRFVILGDPGDSSGESINEIDTQGRPRGKIVVPDGKGGEALVGAPTDGRFLFRVPRELGPKKLTLVAANDDNVIVTKTIDVNVVSAP